MNAAKCRQVLGVSEDAGPEAIRQAYLDLARVWHPDRFQSDERLRRVAEEHLRQINQAYTDLRKGCAEERPAADDPAGCGRKTPPGPARRATTGASRRTPFFVHPGPARRLRLPHLPRFRQPESSGETLLALVLIAAPLWAAYKVVPLLSVPVFDAEMVASRIARPRILMPMSSIDASSDVSSAAAALNEWARGDVVDLWKPVGTEPERPESVAKLPARAPIAPASRVRSQRQQPVTPPANGTELLPVASGGAGELHLSNNSDLDAIVKLAKRGGLVVRVMYIAPKSSATIAAIEVGVYYLYAELGHELDNENLRFVSSRFTPAPLGPFQFGEITTESGVSGRRFDVVLNPRQEFSATRP